MTSVQYSAAQGSKHQVLWICFSTSESCDSNSAQAMPIRMVQPHSSVNKKEVINAVLDKRLLYCCVDPHLLQAMCEEPQDNVSIECTEHVLLSPKAKLMVQAFQLVGREDGVSWHRSPFLRCSLDWSTAKELAAVAQARFRKAARQERSSDV